MENRMYLRARFWGLILSTLVTWGVGLASGISVEVGGLDEDGSLLAAYTCQGTNISPPLSWKGVNDDAKSLAVIMEDLDSPDKVNAHWILYNIPANAIELPRGFNPSPETRIGFGINYRSHKIYLGPCPEEGRHRYVVTVLALSDVLPGDQAFDRQSFWQWVQNYIVDYGVAMVTYKKSM